MIVLPALSQYKPVRTIISAPDSTVTEEEEMDSSFVVEKDSSICISTSRLKRMGRKLVVMMDVDINRNITSDQSVVLYPVLQDKVGNMLQLPEIYINGRRQHVFYQREIADKGQSEAIRRHNDTMQTLHYLRSVPFSRWMRTADLSLIEKDCGCGIPKKTNTSYITNVGDTKSPALSFITPHVEEVKLRNESGRAFLDFPVNVIEIIPDFRNNAEELAKIKRSIDLVKNDTNVVITNINIHGYASPDGPYKFNDYLSCERTKALKTYVSEQDHISDSLMTMNSTPEDIEGFKRMILESTLEKKEEIFKILCNTDEPDVMEANIKSQYPEEYEYMKENILPALRHSDYVIHYIVRPFTVEQAKEVFRTNPKNLSIEEMFRIAQTYPQGSNEYNSVFMTAVVLNPDNPVANLNAACIALSKRDTYMAEVFLTKSPESPEKVLATGVLHLLKGEYEEAEDCFKKAEQQGMKEGTENLKLLNEFY